MPMARVSSMPKAAASIGFENWFNKAVWPA
jgi:hypothetical protein